MELLLVELTEVDIRFCHHEMGRNTLLSFFFDTSIFGLQLKVSSECQQTPSNAKNASMISPSHSRFDFGTVFKAQKK